MKNNKGFTLIELLAVIVILGVIATIAIPSVMRYIDTSRENAFVTEAKSYVSSVGKGIVSGEYEAPKSINDVTVVNLNYIDTDNKSQTSPYGNEWVDAKCYVAVVNEGSQSEPKYVYYFAAQDTDRNAIPLTKVDDISVKSITNKARNTMEVTVQSLTGNISGNNTKKGIISGLTNAIENGEVLDWNVTVYTKSE